MNPEDKQPSKGGRNLAIFGITAVIITFIFSGLSLFIYTASGDIYLDRSRPGFISEGEKADDYGETDQDASFSPDGLVDVTDIDEYLKKLDSIIEEITSDPDAFSSDKLSDEALNITGSAE